MKANEAPENVYLHLTTGSHILNGKYYEYKPAKIRYDDKIIEYTRTDVFVKKAEEFIYSALNDGIMGTANIEDFMRLFKKYMEDSL